MLGKCPNLTKIDRLYIKTKAYGMSNKMVSSHCPVVDNGG